MITIDRVNESYNIAFNYLKNKYGCRRSGHTNGFTRKLRQARNKKEFNEIMSIVTDDDFIMILNTVTEHDDIEIQLLMNQYGYGYTVRFELYNKLCILGVVNKNN
jgi:hypothetical protein